jgi:GT2 family glycosyltransferase
MEKTLWNSDWFCIVCDKPLINHCLCKDDDDKYDNSGFFPNIEGGTARITFGYGSKNDQIDCFIEHQRKEYIACICDDCFDNKKSLIKKVLVFDKKKFVITEEE